MSPRGPIEHVASLQQEPQQCVNMWHTDGKEREVEQPEHYDNPLWQLEHPDRTGEWGVERSNLL